MRFLANRRDLRRPKSPKAGIRPRSTSLAQIIERLERRELLSSDGFLQGTAFIDSNANHAIDSADGYLAGATITLYQLGNPTPLASTTTDANGAYLFQNLAPGNYHLVETPPAGYASSFSDASSQLNPVLGTTANSIDVELLDPSQLNVSANVGGPGWFITNPNRNYDNLNVQFFTQQFETALLNFPVTVTGSGGFSTSFNTYCADLFDYFNSGLNSFQVLRSPGNPVLGQYAGRIGYLYNHYGTQTLSRTDAVALQLAIWKLIYDSGSAIDNGTVAAADFNGASSNVTNNFYVLSNAAPTTSGDMSADLASAAAFINESLGKNEPVEYLDANNGQSPNPDGTAGTQSILATGSLNFANIAKASPTINTTPNTTSVTLGTSTVTLKDTAVLSGGNSPTGTIVFTLVAPGGGVVDTESVAVNGNGTYTTPTGYTLPTSSTVVGTYQWNAAFTDTSGYNFNAADVNDKSEQVTVSPATPAIVTTPKQTSLTEVSPGEFATIGFWHNQNGQAVIDSFNGSASSTALGNWMAANWPKLFGAASPYLSASLAGQTNAQIAADYLNLWTPSGLTKNTYVQAFAVALGLYADTTSLGGQSLLDDGLAAKYGFVVTTGGAGTFNVGSNGAAFGVANNTDLSVSQILADVNASFDPSTGLFYGGDQTKTSAANNVLNGINTMGDIPGGTVLVGSGVDLTDSATLSGGYYPTGTITFKLYAPDGVTVVDTETVTVNGNGTYFTPNGYLPTATGIYEWVASYSGDANNSPVSDNFGDEPVAVGVAGPSFTTIPGGTVVVGSGVKLTDSATLSGAYNPTGSIVFTLYDPNNLAVYTDTVTVNGNGTYSTSTGSNPGGYLPTTVGTYQWVASYSGDKNNSPEAGSLGDEPESVITTISISGTKFLDKTGDSFSSDDVGLGGVTINLYQDLNHDGQLTSADGSPIATTITASSGAYSFNNLAPATYFVQESVPSGYIQTGGGPKGSAGNTYYMVTASGGQSYAGNDFDDAELCDLSKVTCVSYVINGCKTVYDLRGNTHQGDTVTVYFTYNGSGPHDFSFVTYTAPGSTFDASTAYLQQIYQDSTITVPGPGKYSLTVDIPNCYYQIDFVCGDAIDQLGPPDAGPDQSNIFYTPQHRLISADNGGTCATSSVNNGDFATIGFWHNRNGQALINSLNGSSTSTALAQWLVTNFPKLYGAGASTAGTSLINSNGSYFTNAQIAAKYLTTAFFKASGSKTNAQVLAAALAVYATDTDLAGGNFAAKYGFNTSLIGVGGDTFNVGSYGSTFGEANYSNVSVFKLLQDVNAKANSNGTLSSSLFNAANAVFSNINQKGDITLLATGSELAVGGSQLVLSPAVLSSGQLWVSVDGLDAALGAAQEASIDAGIASLNAQLGKYGITLVDVTANADEADMADIDLHLADTTVIGGVDQGVLGVTLFGGDVTLVNGWNWYYGADPTQISSTQFDFQTVATHELGHAIGLGHSTDETSVMFPYLSAGDVRRTLSASDVSIIDAAESGAVEPLLAGGGPSAALQAAIGALFGADHSPTASLASGGLALAAPNAAMGTSPAAPLVGIASGAGRRASFADLFASDDESLADELAADAADAADELYQAAVDTFHSFFG